MESESATCVLDLVDANPAGMTLIQIGTVLGGISRERVRQLQERALKRFAPRLRRELLHAGFDPHEVEIVVARRALSGDEENER